jgi:hypothetical protein
MYTVTLAGKYLQPPGSNNVRNLLLHYFVQPQLRLKGEAVLLPVDTPCCFGFNNGPAKIETTLPVRCID